MENFFLRDSWNKKLTKTEFIESVKEKFNEENIKKLISILQEICSLPNPPPKLIDYFGVLVENYLVFSLAAVDFNNENAVSSYFNLMKCYNKSLFEHCNIGMKEDARASLNALRICLTQNKAIMTSSVLLKLINSTNFLILLASSRLLDRCYYKDVKKLYLDVLPFEGSPIVYPLSCNNFIHAFIEEESQPYKYIFADQDFIHYFTKFLHVFLIYDFFPSTMTKKQLIQIFGLYLNAYYTSSIIIYGLAIHKILQMICNHSDHITKEDIKEIIEDPVFKGHLIMIPFHNNIDKMYEYLFVPSGDFDEEYFLNNFHKTPAYCFKISDMILERIPTGSIGFYNSLASDINVFICLYSQKQIFPLFSSVITLLKSISNPDYFEAVFSFFCTFFIICYNLTNNNDLLDFINMQPSNVQSLIKLIICMDMGKKGPTLPIPIFKKPTGLPMPKIDTLKPFEKCLKFIEIVGNISAQEVLEKVTSFPYLTILAFCEGIIHERKDFIIFLKSNVPDNAILNYRYKQLLNVILPEELKWQNFAGDIYSGVELMKVCPPKSINDIEHYLLKDLYFCFRFDHLTVQDIFIISSRWGYWFQLFGAKNMIILLFTILSKNEFSSKVSQSFLHTCITGICLTISIKNPGLNSQILLSIIELYNSDIEFNEKYISYFFISIFFSLTKDEMDNFVAYVYEIKKNIPNSETKKLKRFLFYMTSCFKNMMYTPSLIHYLKDDIYNIFLSAGDINAVIDYFIIRGNQIDSS